MLQRRVTPCRNAKQHS